MIDSNAASLWGLAAYDSAKRNNDPAERKIDESYPIEIDGELTTLGDLIQLWKKQKKQKNKKEKK